MCGNGKEAHQVFPHRANVAIVEVPGRRNLTSFCGGLDSKNESLPQSRVCGVRSYRLLAGDPLPVVPLGSEEPSSRQRDRSEAGPAGSFCEVIHVPVAVTSQYLHSTSLHALG